MSTVNASIKCAAILLIVVTAVYGYIYLKVIFKHSATAKQLDKNRGNS